MLGTRGARRIPGRLFPY